MSYFPVSVAYTAANFLLALIIILKSRDNQISRFYFFCVSCLVVFGIACYLMMNLSNERLIHVLETIVLFIYAMFPFFFIHFITFFVRQKDMMKSMSINYAIYFAALFSYSVLLLGYIPRPISPTGTMTQTGYIFYVTWMSVFFCIGIAMLFEISRNFRQRIWKSNFVFIIFAILLLILPGPFTDSFLFGILKLKVEYYFYVCTFALLIAVYFIFRHKIGANPVSDALKSALDVMNDVFITMDELFNIEVMQGKIVKEILGYKENEIIGQSLTSFITPKDYLSEYRNFVINRKMKESYFDADLICKDGKRIPMNFSFTPIFINEDLAGFVSVGRDLTEHKRLEEQLRQAQKMESLGTLAGGIAHDINNILQIILVNTSSMKRGILDENKLNKIIEINTNAVKRGSKLIQQILTFARKTDTKLISLDLNAIIKDIVRMLEETFPRTIKFILELTPNIPYIIGDQNQIGQVILNLCVNSRDAMPDGGTISISTRLVMGWDVKEKFPDASTERYVLIQTTDTGCGMNEDVRHRIFEPFFTTKESSKGTGLGLSVVYGIVTSHSGFIDVASDVGVGTTFSIYLPASKDSQMLYEKLDETDSRILKGTETLLVVEDEEILLQFVSALLMTYGYNVIQAKDGIEAVELFTKHKNKIDLVIMDIELPRLNGWEALIRMKKENDGLKAIVASGYLDPKLKLNKRVDGIYDFIQKPYEPQIMLSTIRKVLDKNKF